MITARVQLQQGRLELPSDVLSRLKAWQAAEVPIAVCFVSQSPAGGFSGWLTSSSPQQLLPAAVQWKVGLACAGWGVLLLDQLQQDTNGLEH